MLPPFTALHLHSCFLLIYLNTLLRNPLKLKWVSWSVQNLFRLEHSLCINQKLSNKFFIKYKVYNVCNVSIAIYIENSNKIRRADFLSEINNRLNISCWHLGPSQKYFFSSTLNIKRNINAMVWQFAKF